MDTEFDLISFLNLHLDPSLEKLATAKLLDLLSQYLIIRTLELLPQNNIEGLEDPEKLFTLAKNTIPQYDLKVKEFLEDFKNEYYVRN